jgi:Fur family ferric uptake transcriptional regulator
MSLDVAVSPVQKFQEYLAIKGMRLTAARSIIVKEVFASHEHFDVDTLVDRLSKRADGRRVSRSSIYRAISWLEEAGLVRKVARTNDRDVYEHDYGYPQHDHLICSKCGTLIEFRNQAISELLEDVAAEHGFRMKGHRLEVYGMCAACSRPPQRRHRKLDMV